MNEDEMTLRKYYAGLAMKGYIAGGISSDKVDMSPQTVAKCAVMYADALVEAINMLPDVMEGEIK